MPEIVVKFADKVIERIVTEKDHISIGRTSDNDVVLDNGGISRRHARIDFADNRPELIDLDSLNGTFVNQQKVTRQFLQDNDRITVGKFDLIFFEDTQKTAKSPDRDKSAALDVAQPRESTQAEKSNPLKDLMETRPIPVPLKSENQNDRKEHR